MADTHANNGYDSPYRAIQDVTNDEFSNLVLLYSDSQESAYRALAFQVTRTHRRIERLTTEPTLAADGNAGDTLDFGYLGENGHQSDVSDPGDEILQVFSDRERTIIEYGISVEPDGVLVGVQTPGNVNVFGVADSANRARGYGVDNLGQFGAIDSQYTRTDTPDEVPTTALSTNPDQGIMRIDSDEDGRNPIRLALSNTTASQETVSIEAVGTSYEVRPVTNQQKVRDMVVGKGYDARVVTWGGEANLNPNLPQDWRDYVTDIASNKLLP